MIFHSSKLMLTAALSSMCVISSVPVEAGCHGRSGGSSYGSSYSSHSSYRQPVYSSPGYSQPVYAQPIYSQPVYPQFQPDNIQTQPLQQFGSGQPGGSASGPATRSTTAAGQSQFAIPGTAAPGTSVVQTGGVQSPNNEAPVNSSSNDAQQSALQALGGFAPPQDTNVALAASPSTALQTVQTQQPSFAGKWTANLANGARIQLALQADGTFSWTAVNKEGQSSVFQGTYAVENGSLSLTRSNDSQKLSGIVTTTGANTFSFKLSVAQSPSIDFVRG